MTGARLFFGSLESAIFLFNRIIGISLERYISPPPLSRHSQVYPVIDTNKSVTIGVELVDGTTILGQNQISHPPPLSVDAGQDGPSMATHVDKGRDFCALKSPVKRLFYVNEYLQVRFYYLTAFHLLLSLSKVHEYNLVDGLRTHFSGACPQGQSTGPC